METGSVLGVRGEEVEARRPEIARMMKEEQERIEHVSQVVEKLRFYFEEPGEPDAGAAKALQKRPGIETVIAKYAEVLAVSFSEDPKALEESARRFAEAEGVPLADLAQPLRAVLTGRSATPPLFSVMAILGKEKCLRRLAQAGRVVEKARAARPAKA